MAIKGRFPAIRPSLDLNFAKTKRLDPRITFTRASIGTYVGRNGLIKTAGVNEARFDHSPTTGESLGLLVEEARTNSIRNNTMVGAVAGTPGTNPNLWQYVTTQSNGLTQTIVGVGTESGITYIDYQFNGTTVASANAIAFGLESNAAAAVGQTWTSSIYLRLVGGTTTGISSFQLGLIENNSGGSFVGGAVYTIATPTNGSLVTQRYSATRTLTTATAAFCVPTMGINVANNTVVDFTIRIGLPQLEQGAFATSVIPTTTATATRAADVASITGSNFSSWYNQTEGTLYWEGVIDSALPSGSFGQFFDFRTDGPNRLSLYWNPTTTNNVGFFVMTGGVTQVTTQHSLGTNVQSKLSGAYKINDFASSLSGSVVQTDTSGTLPTSIVASIGSAGAGSVLGQQRIRRLTYWPQRLSNATLQALTS